MAVFCHVMFYSTFFWVCLWQGLLLCSLVCPYEVIQDLILWLRALKKTSYSFTCLHACTRNPIMWTNREIFEITSVWDRRQTTGSYAGLSWKQTQVHCNYTTARPICGRHSHNCSATATTNSPSAYSNHTATERGQRRAILAIAAEANQS